MHYTLLDSGDQKKFERFGPYTIVRPCSQATWKPALSHWDADAQFSKERGWVGKLPHSWVVELDGLRFKLAPTDFGHLGIFPEHQALWSWAAGLVGEGASVLNLFAYSGGATLAFARAGAQVCHVDAAQGLVNWARENAVLNELSHLPIRWIVEDAMKFLGREVRRGRKYDGILLDPPSFGRGAKGEVFKIQKDFGALLKLCRELLSDRPLFLACSNHSAGVEMRDVFEEVFSVRPEVGELVLGAEKGRDVPTGNYARWQWC